MLLSRVADGLYWISRYLERAEHTARLIDVRVDLALDRTAEAAWDFAPLYASLRLDGARGIPSSPDALVAVAVFDSVNADSVLSCVTAARENARQVREEISADMWEHVNRLFLRIRQMRADGALRAHTLARVVIEGTQMFQGITDATMGRGEGWQYLQLGRFLERAGATAVLLDHHLEGAPGDGRRDPVEWVALLRSSAAFEAYCRFYTADLRADRIAEFLLLNADFPRSVRFATAQIEQSLRSIADLTGRGAGGRALRLAGRLRASLDFGQVDEILSDEPGRYLGDICRQCEMIHHAVQQSYLVYPIETAIPA